MNKSMQQKHRNTLKKRKKLARKGRFLEPRGRFRRGSKNQRFFTRCLDDLGSILMDLGIIFDGCWLLLCSSICRMSKPPGTKRNSGKHQEHAEHSEICRTMHDDGRRATTTADNRRRPTTTDDRQRPTTTDDEIFEKRK